MFQKEIRWSASPANPYPPPRRLAQLCFITGRRHCALDLAHVAMMHAWDVAIVPGDHDAVPSCCADYPPVGGAPTPINAGAFLESPGFGGSHLIHVAIGFRLSSRSPLCAKVENRALRSHVQFPGAKVGKEVPCQDLRRRSHAKDEIDRVTCFQSGPLRKLADRSLHLT